MRHPILFVLLCLAAGGSVGCKGDGSMSSQGVGGGVWGDLSGVRVQRFTLRNGNGMEVDLCDYGAMVTSVRVPDRNGGSVDVVLGFDSIGEYPEKSQYFGCTVGRVGNRIAGGSFELDGQSYSLAINNGPNHLHGGERGFDKYVWNATELLTSRGPGVRFSRSSPAGEEGYPGTLEAEAVYVLTENDELVIEMSATTDARTPCNIVHHTYWNLGGHGSGTVLDETLIIDADRYTPVDATLLPTGELALVDGTPLDFRAGKSIGSDFGAFPANGDDPGGFDHNLCLNGEVGTVREVARLSDSKTGIVMTISTDQPGIQFYTGNFLNGMMGKGGAIYEQNGGLCLETQAFPDSINHRGEAGWSDVVLRPGTDYRHVMVHRFSVD
jgi:aldose 1-epimerase